MNIDSTLVGIQTQTLIQSYLSLSFLKLLTNSPKLFGLYFLKSSSSTKIKSNLIFFCDLLKHIGLLRSLGKSLHCG